MKAAVLLLLALLAVLVVSTVDLSETADKELGDLLSKNWYNLLPERVKSERTELLKLLKPS